MSRLEFAESPDFDGALCRTVDPELFFPAAGTHTAKAAKAICHKCPELEPCRDYVLKLPVDVTGIWGALTSNDRRAIRALESESLYGKAN